MHESPLLADPDILVPGPLHGGSPEFILRLLDWATDGRFKIGPNTFVEFSDWAGSVFEEMRVLPPGFARQDIISAVSKLFARGLPRTSTSQSSHSFDSISTYYSPYMGLHSNVELLQDDLVDLRLDLPVILATDERCWNRESWPLAIGREDSDKLFAVYNANDDACDYWRWLITSPPLTFEKLKCFASAAFPKLVFADSAWGTFSSMQGKVYDLVPLLVSHLSALNDYAIAIWQVNNNNHERIQNMVGLGVDCSPESTKTHSNKKAMKQRVFTFGSQNLMCEWHTKLDANRNRIHFSVEESRVLIGCFAYHLGT